MCFLQKNKLLFLTSQSRLRKKTNMATESKFECGRGVAAVAAMLLVYFDWKNAICGADRKI